MIVQSRTQEEAGMNQRTLRQVSFGGARNVELSATPHGFSGGFSLVELMVAMVVFTVIAGAVGLLLTKSQTIFRAEQGVSEMDQNARLLMDFLTRDVQQSKENGLGLGQRFRSIYSRDGAEGKTDEVTIVTADTASKVPAGSLPLMSASPRPFTVAEHYVELIPGGTGRVDPSSIASTIAPNEEFVLTGTRADGSVQFDFIQVQSVKVLQTGVLAVNFNTVDHPGVTPEVPFGSTYETGAFSVRPVAIKRYFVDRQDKDHPIFALSVNNGTPIPIARNVVAFQMRYLEVKDGEVDGNWVKQQTISRSYKTQAVEVTMTARTEVKNDDNAQRLVTLASVIRPRLTPGGNFGSSPSDGAGGATSPGLPGDVAGNGSGGPGGGYGGGDPSAGGNGGQARGYDANGQPIGSDGSGLGNQGMQHRTRYIGKQPKLGERLNPQYGDNGDNNNQNQ